MSARHHVSLHVRLPVLLAIRNAKSKKTTIRGRRASLFSGGEDMIHKFSMGGKNIVLDVNSGAVHVVDKLVFDMLDYVQVPLSREMPFSGDEKEAYAEILELYDNGLLFSEEVTNLDIARLHRNAPVKALCLHVAHDCNLRCGYCFADTGEYRGGRELMSAEIGKKAIDFVIENSQKRRNIEIDFFGGEPLMNFEVVKEIVEYARQKEKLCNKVFRFTLTTNGVLLDDEKLRYINEYMSNLVLSLDGRKEVNDRMRKTVSGTGSYDLILPKLKKAADSRGQKNYYLRGTFTRHNLDFAEDVFHIADLGFKQISVEPVVAENEKDFAIKNEDLPQIFEEYEKLAKEYLKNSFTFFHFMLELQSGPCIIKRMSGCGAGSEYLAISPSGDIYPCHQFVGNKEFYMGNVNHDGYNHEIRDIFANTNLYTKHGCSECWAKFHCSGGCHANAYSFNKDINKPYGIACEMEKKRVECALFIEAEKAGDTY